jgi:carboxylesterase type B
VQNEDVVVVTINYRLGWAGFLTLDVFDQHMASETDARGANFGFMDMVIALEWVRDNIRSFGGDPGKVTIYGQSSGGTAVFALLASPKARGLFHRAYSLSGSPRMDAPLAATRHHALVDPENFAKRSKCADAGEYELYTCLLSMTLEELQVAAPPAWDAGLEPDHPDSTDRQPIDDEVDDMFGKPIPYHMDSWGMNGRYAPLAVMDGSFLPAACGKGLHKQSTSACDVT